MQFSSKRSLISLFTLFIILLAGLPLKAQDRDFTDNELKSFSKVVVEVITIQQNTQRDMIAIIQENNLTVPRFNQMMAQAQELGEEGIEGTEEEKRVFFIVADAFNGIQDRMIDDLTKAIVSKGLSLERYEAILQRYQSDPDFQARVHTLAEEN
ncbi:MAG: DUF4168 domain-containing protein [Bacteroidales bacterium]|nr:DUF4168 domain-containing protein [Bacteroidales bacterium]